MPVTLHTVFPVSSSRQNSAPDFVPAKTCPSATVISDNTSPMDRNHIRSPLVKSKQKTPIAFVVEKSILFQLAINNLLSCTADVLSMPPSVVICILTLSDVGPVGSSAAALPIEHIIISTMAINRKKISRIFFIHINSMC